MDNTEFCDEETLYCPYCERDFPGRDFEDGDTGQVTCERCGSVYKYEVEVSYSFDITGIKPGEKPSLNQDKTVKREVLVGYTMDSARVIRVDAEEIEIPGFEEFSFYLRINGWHWIVFEESTGMMICEDFSRDEVIAKALNVMERAGKEEMAECVARCPKISEREVDARRNGNE